VTLVVANDGRIAAPPTELAVAWLDPGGQVGGTVRFPVPALAPGDLATIPVETGPQGSTGEMRLRATLDPDLMLAEGSRDATTSPSSSTA
jgi:hypothetical protein